SLLVRVKSAQPRPRIENPVAAQLRPTPPEPLRRSRSTSPPKLKMRSGLTGRKPLTPRFQSPKILTSLGKPRLLEVVTLRMPAYASRKGRGVTVSEARMSLRWLESPVTGCPLTRSAQGVESLHKKPVI